MVWSLFVFLRDLIWALCEAVIAQVCIHHSSLLGSLDSGSDYLLDPMPLSRHSQKGACSLLDVINEANTIVWRPPDL